jgi:hypothetical protein
LNPEGIRLYPYLYAWCVVSQLADDLRINASSTCY